MILNLTRRMLLGGAFALAFTLPGLSADRLPFDQSAFDQAQAAGLPILVHVTADWCEVCQAQKPVVAELTSKPPLASMAVFNVDFDTQKDLLRAFRVQHQSTLIVFKGAEETGRSTGVSNPAKLEALLRSAL